MLLLATSTLSPAEAAIPAGDKEFPELFERCSVELEILSRKASGVRSDVISQFPERSFSEIRPPKHSRSAVESALDSNGPGDAQLKFTMSSLNDGRLLNW
jgi:hypothetical protein